MKATALFKLVALLFLLCSFRTLAVPTNVIEKVEFKNNKVLVWPGGEVLKAPNEITLPFGIVVRTNGAFTVKGGKARALQEGDILGTDGMLIKPDGSITPVMDHVSLNRGRVVVMKDGETTELRDVLQLGDGTTVSPDGKITPRVGSARMLLDGELFQLEGGALPARDTITMKNGQVVVQKDGSKLVVDPERSITMNDGTKVMGDGTIIKFNGDRLTLSEGQIFTLDGVVTRPR